MTLLICGAQNCPILETENCSYRSWGAEGGGWVEFWLKKMKEALEMVRMVAQYECP